MRKPLPRQVRNPSAPRPPTATTLGPPPPPPVHNSELVRAAGKVLEAWKTGSLNDLAYAMQGLEDRLNER